MKTTADEILKQVQATLKQRGQQYDQSPDGEERSMKRATAAYKAITGTDMTVIEGYTFMACLKLVRGNSGSGKLDDWHDLAGYSALAGEEVVDSLTVYDHSVAWGEKVGNGIGAYHGVRLFAAEHPDNRDWVNILLSIDEQEFKPVASTRICDLYDPDFIYDLRTAITVTVKKHDAEKGPEQC